MNKKQMLFASVTALFFCLSSASAQEEVFQRGLELGVGARALGMGGAYVGIGDDYSASYWNPAALTQIRRLEGFGTFSHTERTNDISFGTLTQSDDASFTSFNSLGLAYPIPTYRGSLVFSLGYHRIRPYESTLDFSLFNDTPGDSVAQRWSELEEGSLNNWTLAGATEVAPNFSVGLAVNIWSGKSDFQSSFIEEDVLDLYTFRDFRQDNNLVSEFSGINLKLAGLYRASSLLRLGFTLSTPTTLKVTDTWRVNEETGFDEDGIETFTDRGSFEYKIRSPFSLGAGASVNLAGLLLAGSVEFNDWSQIRYTTEPPIEGLSEAEANDEIARNYRSTAKLRLGAEVTVPLVDLQVRGGYTYDPTPLDLEGIPDAEEADREFFTLGLGIFLDKQVRLDLAFMTGEWREFKQPLDDLSDDTFEISEEISFNKAFATLAFRF